MPGEHADAFQASVKRCLESPSFIKDFYERFTGTSEEIREKFRNTDFERQNRMLADSLYAMVVAVQGGPKNLVRRDMKRLAQRHQEMHITSGMYDTWLECLLQSAKAFDPQFSPALEQAWRETLSPGIEYMRAGKPFES
ncbi:MAG: globin domain-containing protein [Gemmatimonadales bacterium]